MLVKRRGRRTRPDYVGKSLHSGVIRERIPNEREEKLLLMLQKLIRPSVQPPKINLYYQKLYENLNESQQKNLIDKIANQILAAHHSVRETAFANLSAFSVDFSQKAEVSLRRLLLGKSA